jgi:hypothetical protein
MVLGQSRAIAMGDCPREWNICPKSPRLKSPRKGYGAEGEMT